MASQTSEQKRRGLPPIVSNVFIPLAGALIGIGPWLVEGQLPRWAVWVAMSFFVFVSLSVLWCVLAGPLRALSERWNVRRAHRENFTAVRGAMASLSNALSLNDVRCIYGLSNRLASNNIVVAESITILGSLLRSLLSWLLTERERLEKGSSNAITALVVSRTVLAAYVNACNSVGNLLRAAVARGDRVDGAIRGEWVQVADYANGLVRTHEETTERVNARLCAQVHNAYIEPVNASIGS